MEYLVHVISGEGVATHEQKVGAVKCFPTPKTVKKLRGFWVLRVTTCGLYRIMKVLLNLSQSY